MIFQTHDMAHPNQIRLNTLIAHYDRAYSNSQINQPLSHFNDAKDIDLNDVLEFRGNYDAVH